MSTRGLNFLGRARLCSVAADGAGARFPPALMPAHCTLSIFFPSLLCFRLRLCGITDDASKLLSRGFQQCPAVEEIILSWNALGDGGAQVLASILPGMETLKMLDLEKNLIGACGATRLAEELVRCPEIQFIRLWDNPVPKGLAESLTSQDPRLCFSFC